MMISEEPSTRPTTAAQGPSGGPTRLLAEFALSIEASSAPEPVRHEAARILLDCVGCAVAGLVTPAGRIALDVVKDEHGPLEATAVSTGRVSVAQAAFANTVLNNALDFEPVGPEGHVCAVAVPVALAMAEALDASGEELLAGLLAGLEIGGRVGGAIRRVAQGGAKVTPPVRGTAHAAFAAVAAAGRLLRLTPDQMANAFGIAAYGANVPSLKKVMTSAHAPMTKYDHLGLMAQSGIQAALLAQRGFTGDTEALEGEFGFWRFAGALGCDWDFLTRDLGRAWTIPETWFKRYPAILYTGPGLDLARRLVREHDIPLDRIERVEIRAMRTNEVQSGKEILTEMDAWTSYAYNTAASMADVRPWRAWQEPDTYRRADLLKLTRKVDLRPLSKEELPPAGNYWEGWCPVRATIRFDGRTVEGGQDALPKLDDAELGAKFRENVTGLLADEAASRLEQACWDPAAVRSAREMAQPLAEALLPAPSLV